MERICTDVAFLKDGTVNIHGKLSEIKNRYRSNEYVIETENDSDTHVLLNTLSSMKKLDRNRVSFTEDKHSVSEVLSFIADSHIPLLRFERSEPSLEELFMEVTEK